MRGLMKSFTHLECVAGGLLFSHFVGDCGQQAVVRHHRLRESEQKQSVKEPNRKVRFKKAFSSGPASYLRPCVFEQEATGPIPSHNNKTDQRPVIELLMTFNLFKTQQRNDSTKLSVTLCLNEIGDTTLYCYVCFICFGGSSSCFPIRRDKSFGIFNLHNLPYYLYFQVFNHHVLFCFISTRFGNFKTSLMTFKEEPGDKSSNFFGRVDLLSLQQSDQYVPVNAPSLQL